MDEIRNINIYSFTHFEYFYVYLMFTLLIKTLEKSGEDRLNPYRVDMCSFPC